MTIRPRSVATLAAALALVAIAPRPAEAEGPHVLFVASASTPFSARVRAEIEAMGFEVLNADDLAEGSACWAVFKASDVLIAVNG